MRDASTPLQDCDELAQQAFASQGYTPAQAVLRATVKGLTRLVDPLPAPQGGDANVSFEAMLKRCAGV